MAVYATETDLYLCTHCKYIAYDEVPLANSQAETLYFFPDTDHPSVIQPHSGDQAVQTNSPVFSVAENNFVFTKISDRRFQPSVVLAKTMLSGALIGPGIFAAITLGAMLLMFTGLFFLGLSFGAFLFLLVVISIGGYGTIAPSIAMTRGKVIAFDPSDPSPELRSLKVAACKSIVAMRDTYDRLTGMCSGICDQERTRYNTGDVIATVERAYWDSVVQLSEMFPLLATWKHLDSDSRSRLSVSIRRIEERAEECEKLSSACVQRTVLGSSFGTMATEDPITESLRADAERWASMVQAVRDMNRLELTTSTGEGSERIAFRDSALDDELRRMRTG